jgi:hypothetical protein
MDRHNFVKKLLDEKAKLSKELEDQELAIARAKYNTFEEFEKRALPLKSEILNHSLEMVYGSLTGQDGYRIELLNENMVDDESIIKLCGLITTLREQLVKAAKDLKQLKAKDYIQFLKNELGVK